MKVQVTKEDITSGVPNHQADCPLAKAITRATGKPTGVMITHYYYIEDDIDQIHKLPQIAYEFRKNFDGGVAVQPFEFEIP